MHCLRMRQPTTSAPGDEVAYGQDAVEGDGAALVIKLNPAVQETLAKLTQRQSAFLRRAVEPVTSAWLQQHADWGASLEKTMLGSIGTSGLQDVGKAFAGLLPKFELSLPNLSAFTELQTNLSALTALQTSVARLVSGIDFGAIRRALRGGQPPNWDELGDRVRLSTLLEITEAGLPTAWVPRASVLVELLEADEADRPGVFADRRSEIVEDCKTVLNDITSSELAELVELLNEALDVAHDGRMAAAQALAASIFDTILRKTFPQQSGRYYAKVKAEIADRHEDASLAEMRWGFVHLPALIVLTDFWEHKGDTIPTKFNRHASAHAVGRAQYTPANAVIGLALATSLVREAHQVIVDKVVEAA